MEAALDWISQHDEEGEGGKQEQEEEEEEKEEERDGEPKSLCCNDCGKLFSSVAIAQLHAAKTGHQDFSESDKSMPELTPEQKAARLAELRTKLAEKRQEEAQRAEEEARQAEVLRRKSGHTAAQARRELAERETIKAAEQMRKDREEERQIRARIRAEMEEERRLRKAAAAASKETEAAAAEGATTTVPELVSSNAETVRIQVKLPDGGQVRAVFRAEEPLAALLDRLAEETDITSACQLVVPFPHKIIDPATESQSTFRDLGLCPSASLVLKP